ncbi:MAG: general stress protein [Gemmatimonadota bacterium]|nr:general stress protein [Gemmatimonadota bacterium]
MMQAHAEHAASTLDAPDTSTATTKSAIVTLYDTHQEAEEAVRALHRDGVDMRQLSIVSKGQETEDAVVGFYTAEDRMKAWGKHGAFWGALWSLMFGSAFFLIPGIGPLLAAGPIVGWIVGALEGAVVVGGLGALGAGLYSIGMPKESILEYERHVQDGKFVVVAHGDSDAMSKTEDALAATRHHGMKKHSCCA